MTLISLPVYVEIRLNIEHYQDENRVNFVFFFHTIGDISYTQHIIFLPQFYFIRKRVKNEVISDNFYYQDKILLFLHNRQCILYPVYKLCTPVFTLIEKRVKNEVSKINVLSVVCK